MWPPQVAGLLLVICTSSYSVPTNKPSEAAGEYQFGWTVRDDETGDYKTHHEEAMGVGGGRGVRGEYTVGEPNGDLRVVSYSVAPGTGFQATVRVLPGGSPVGSSVIRGSPVGGTVIGESSVGGSDIGDSPVTSSVIRGSPVESSVNRGSPVESSVLGGSPVGGSPVASSVIKESPVEGSVITGSSVESSVTRGSKVGGSAIGDSPVASSVIRESPVESSVTGGSPVASSAIGDSAVEGSVIRGAPVRSSIIESSPTEGSVIGDSPIESSATGGSPVESSTIGGPPIRNSVVGGSISEGSAIGNSPLGGSIIEGSPRTTPMENPEEDLASASTIKEVQIKANIPHTEVPNAEHPPEMSKTKNEDSQLISQQDEVHDKPPEGINLEETLTKTLDQKSNEHESISQQEKIIDNNQHKAVKINQAQSESVEQNHNGQQSMSQMLEENKSLVAGISKDHPAHSEENKGPQAATEDINKNRLDLKAQDVQRNEQAITQKTGNTFKPENVITDSSLTEKPIDLLKDLPHIDKHIHNIDYIMKREREEELQAKKNDFAASDFSQGNQMIVKVHENESDQNHDLMELAPDVSVGQVNGMKQQLITDQYMDVDSVTSIDQTKIEPTFNVVTRSSVKPTPDTIISSSSSDTSQSHVEPAHINSAKTHDSDQTKEPSHESKQNINNSKDEVNNFSETNYQHPVDSLMLAALMTSASPVIKFTCLPDIAVKNSYHMDAIVPTTGTQNPTNSKQEPYITTTFPILPFTMVNFGPTRLQPPRPVFPLGSKPSQAGHVMNNYVTISTTIPQPHPTNTAQIDKHKQSRSNLESDFPPGYANAGLYPGYLLPPPWVRAQHHHGSRHMPIFVLPMSHNANLAPTFNPEMIGKHNHK